jgi:putative phosphoesterase
LRIGIISDIHCDVRALERALKEMQDVDRVLCAGDLVLQYRFSNEVVDIIRHYGIPTVQGNHEAAVLSSAGAAMRANGAIRPDNLAFTENLPSLMEMMIENKQFIMMHTSPLDPTGGGRDLRDGMATGDGPIAQVPESRADVLIVGHTHKPIVAQVGRTLVINPGSLGQSRDPVNPHLRTYAIMDTSTWSASISSFNLPPEG